MSNRLPSSRAAVAAAADDANARALANGTLVRAEPTDAQLLAAIARGIAAGDLVVFEPAPAVVEVTGPCECGRCPASAG